MPKPSTSSSSSEDLAIFQSVAVSFEEISSKQKEVAEQAKQRIAGGTKRKSKAKRHSSNGADKDDAERDSGDDDGPLDQLNPIQLKIAMSLDSLLEGRLRVKEPGPGRKRKEARRAERAEAAAAVSTTGAGGFRFFSRTQPGSELVLEPPELPPLKGTTFPDVLRRRRAPSEEEGAAALSVLAVDGITIVTAAAAAAATAGAAMTAAGQGTSGGAGGQDPGQAVAVAPGGNKKKKQKKSTQHLGEGVVVEDRPFVPHDERIRRLVGGP